MEEKEEKPVSSVTSQRDFFNWLRKAPHEILQELYASYLFQKRNGRSRRDVASDNMVVPKPIVDNPPSRPEIIVLRRSIFFLLLTIFSIEISFDIFFLVLKLFPLLLPTPNLLQNLVNMYSLPVFVVLSIVKALFMIFAAFAWISTRFEIHGDAIRFKRGILFTNEKVFMCTYTQEVTCSQSLWGRIFNYGTVEVFNPTIKETIYMDAIPNPHRYVEIIKNNLPDTSNAKLIPL